MSEKRFELGSTVHMERREAQAAEFYSAVLDPDEQPWLVSDEAGLWDIYSGDQSDLSRHCQAHYGVWLRQEHFDLPFWQVLDYLEQHRIK